MRTPILCAVALAAAGCTSAYYGVMQKLGYEKRDILVDRVEKGRDSQHAAKKQFENALEAFKSVVAFEGGDLEKTYRKLSDEYDSSEERVRDVGERIQSIEKVAGDLFDEWRAEIRQISSPDLRSKSDRLLRDTKDRYATLIDAMKTAESKMQPVLVEFRDRVLFLKHNLNAKAIASLQSDVGAIDAKVADLLRDMEKSIAEADEFVRSMNAES
jgi:hypothetical protein